MPSEACVGRVGGLAVALGIGAAVVTGWSSGLAWADQSAGGAGSTAAASDTQPGTANADTTQGPAESGDPGADAAAANDDAEGSEDPDDVDTGELTEDAPESTTDTPPSGTSGDPATSKGSGSVTGKPANTKSAASVSSIADVDQDATHEETSDDVGTRARLFADGTDDAASLPNAATLSLSTDTRTAEPTTESTPDLISPVVTIVTRLASGVVNAILSPFATTDAPGGPAAMPSIWSLMAFVRREFENAFSAPSLTDTPAAAQTTGQVIAEPEERTLVLSAFPAEADAILARTTLDPNPTVVVDGRHFYLGTLGGKKVIVAMTGIGMENATQTTETALSHFTPESGISIDSVVFSGVAGGSGRTDIGSVAVPARWTSDDGATWHAVDPGMLVAANGLTVDLESVAPLGDPLCLCSPLAHIPLIDLKREPQLFVGGDGSSDDNNNGAAFPAIPFGGDIFGPQPCSAPDRSLLFTGNFFQAVVPFLAQGLFSNLTGLLMPEVPAVDAVDQETAAAQQVAEAHGIPFLGIRGMSDGPGDPLGLPGYPFTFVVYHQIAADNAAIVTEAFLQSWDGA